jgi:regulator of protease activity HflC (stomatin/prohibitin superfamily)
MERDLSTLNIGEIKGKLGKPSKWVVIIIAAVIVFWILNPFVVVGAGERGVVLNFGAVQPHVLGEGIHFRVPIMQSIIKMDVTIQKAQTDAESVSKDLQDTKSTIAVNYHIVPDQAN